MTYFLVCYSSKVERKVTCYYYIQLKMIERIVWQKVEGTVSSWSYLANDMPSNIISFPYLATLYNL